MNVSFEWGEAYTIEIWGSMQQSTGSNGISQMEYIGILYNNHNILLQEKNKSLTDLLLNLTQHGREVYGLQNRIVILQYDAD